MSSDITVTDDELGLDLLELDQQMKTLNGLIDQFLKQRQALNQNIEGLARQISILHIESGRDTPPPVFEWVALDEPIADYF